MKVISQEIFDEIVLQNITEFDSTLAEAIEDAIKEFKAQGVVFCNIVTNSRLNDDNTLLIHDVLESLKVIENRNEASDEKVSEALKMLTSQFKLSIAHRVLCTKHDGFKILCNYIEELKESGNDNRLALTLESMTAMTDTNPDILNEPGTKLLVDLLQTWSTRSDNDQVILYLASWCIECCLKHEANRQTLVLADAPTPLISMLLANNTNRIVIKATIKALRCFVLDDDIRVPYGKIHDHARLLADEHRMIKISLQILQGFTDDNEVASEILSTLSRLCVRAEYCQEAVDNNVLLILNNILVAFPDSVQVSRQSINLLRTISGNDKVKEEVMKLGSGQLIVSALSKHQNSASMCEAACGAISMLALRVVSHAKQLVQYGAADAVVQAMKIHFDNKKIQVIGCMAIRNLCCKDKENCKELISCQVESVLRTAMEKFGSDHNLKDVAKAALRDLNLEVKLEEIWKGTGVQMEMGD